MTLRSRFLLLRALRWLPTGLLIPVLVLYVLDQGFTLSQFGLAVAVQGAAVLLLELPTGGLADVIGARRVLAMANVAELASLGLLLVVDTVPVLMLFWGLQGLFRALESGPLEAWYVNRALGSQSPTDPADEPDRQPDREPDIEGDMAKAGTVSGLALGTGSMAAGALVAVAGSTGIEPLLLPILVAAVLRLIDLAAVVALLDDRVESDQVGPGRIEPSEAGLRASMGQVPAVIGATLRLVSRSRPLAALLAVELLWGIGLVAFETLFPPRLAEVTADPERAAGLLGPIGTGAWLVAAGGAAAIPWISRRVGPAAAGAGLRIAQGLTVAAIAVLGGPVLLIVAYLATMAIHGASNVVHVGILHGAIGSAQRTTVLSANSMAAHLGGGIGSIGLGAIATGVGLPTAMIVGAACLAAAAPLYLVARPPDRPESESAPG